MNLVKTKEYKFFFGSCDINGDIRISKLADVLAQIADEQVDDIKQHYTFLNDPTYHWILVRYHMDITRLPKGEESFCISTYQSYYSKYTCIRDYVIQTTDGEPLVFAQCQWVMVDYRTRRIAAIPKEYDTLTTNTGRGNKELLKIDEAKDETWTSFDLRTRYDDYDYNGHVNNTVYYSFILNDQIEIDHERLKIKTVDINYKTGMLFGKAYRMHVLIENSADLCVLSQKIDNEDGVAALMRTEWVAKETE